MSTSPVPIKRPHPPARASKRKRADSPKGIVQEVTNLSAEMRELVDKLLIEDGTFEDVVETVEERSGKKLALRAVQRYFRSNLPLQQRRIQFQLEVAKGLKEAAGDPESAQNKLVDAVLLTGLMRLRRRDAHISTQDAVLEQYKRDNLRIHEDQNRLREQKLRLERRLVSSRLETELNKQNAIKAKLAEMQLLMESRQGRKELGSEALKKIQEIYGLISQEKPETPSVHA